MIYTSPSTTFRCLRRLIFSSSARKLAVVQGFEWLEVFGSVQVRFPSCQGKPVHNYPSKRCFEPWLWLGSP